jgi:rRNA maturation endonuclease Nob1
MKIHIHELLIFCKGYHETVPFSEVTYFHGQMGAGKSTIARLVDYCLGGGLAMTPALDAEFVSAQLKLSVEDKPVLLERRRSSDFILAQWSDGKDAHEASLPARKASGEAVPGTGIEVLSDLFFHLVGMNPPRVRRSKLKEDSELGRLSLRDLLWYCYLDQDSMDSDFFHLDSGGDQWKKLKSRDVLRFVLGFHQEQVSELEAQLEQLRARRLMLEGGAEALRQALAGADFSSRMEIEARLNQIKDRVAELSTAISNVRSDAGKAVDHATESLRVGGRRLASDLAETDEAVTALTRVLQDDRRHLNELRSLSTKFRRMESARAVLNGVEFEACPRCAKPLPLRDSESCRVCGQPEAIQQEDASKLDTMDADLVARTAEIEDGIKRRTDQLASYRRRSAQLVRQKAQLDFQLDRASEEYDSAFLSRALSLEQERSRLLGEAAQLERLRVLPQKVEDQLREATAVETQEVETRKQLKAAREKAEKDAGNLRTLEKLFLDCLVQARVPGFKPTDLVQMRSPTFVPEVSTPEEHEMIFTSFANLGSGGKKTLFKCCFAIALHRLAAKIGAVLPTILIIDSPMKNISERENKEQFEGFHKMLYDLAGTELKGTQVVLIDKEFVVPEDPVLKLLFEERRMSPDKPLLRGFKPTEPPPDSAGTEGEDEKRAGTG